MQEPEGPRPEHLLLFCGQNCRSRHTAGRWWRHWVRMGLVRVEIADKMPDGIGLWTQWKQALVGAGDPRDSVRADLCVMEEDAGRFVGFVWMIARRT